MLDRALYFIKKVIPNSLFLALQPYYHWALAVTGNVIYRFPGYKITVIGVTGTNGKSTTTEIITEVLKVSGKKVGMISTVSIEIAGKRWDNATNRTTLGRWKTQRLLRKMVSAGCDIAVVEVASEGIAWYRILGIPFDCAVFTNLAPEHLNFHRTMENYRDTKGRLFAKLSNRWNFKRTKRISVINADDEYAKYFSSFKSDKKYLYGLEKGEIRASGIKAELEKTNFVIEFEGKKIPVSTKAVGAFNVYNLLAGFCVGTAYGVPQDQLVKALSDFSGTKGRVERIEKGQSFSVIIDYAVTPDAQAVVYEELRKFTEGKLIAVFGATGDRDKLKRPKMAQIATKLCDFSIITDDETYSEESQDIINDVYKGVEKADQNRVTIVPDRYQAIKRALTGAKKGDTVVITGMGHQKYRNMGGKKLPWNEREIVAELLENLIQEKIS